MKLSGFGNYHATEAIEGALPLHQNSPQICPLGLYAEQLSGSAFTEPRHQNRHSWLYRILPSVVQADYVPCSKNINSPPAALQTPNPLRWSAFAAPNQDQDFIDGLSHIATSARLNLYIYQLNQSMQNRFLSSYDGEFLFIPYRNNIQLKTELGIINISPGQIGVIPRGVKFCVMLTTDNAIAEGYVCENGGASLTLPNLGIIGANALANPRHFRYPSASFEEVDNSVELVCKYQQQWWQATSPHSPLNVVAWHGNYAPYTYDLSLFNTINSVSFDHPDPSIFTVLSAPSDTPGVSNLDFVIFPERWIVSEHTFRPPYFHRNVMSEFMGLIKGSYDAKDQGFEVGGMSIHNAMCGHGPDAISYAQAIEKKLAPERYNNTLAFMLESREPWLITQEALNHPQRQQKYTSCWKGLKSSFK